MYAAACSIAQGPDTRYPATADTSDRLKLLPATDHWSLATVFHAGGGSMPGTAS